MKVIVQGCKASFKMDRFLVILLVAGSLVKLCHAEHEHIIIHVPYYIKTIKHTHTITKHIPDKSRGDDHYEVLGYTVGHPIDLREHGGVWPENGAELSGQISDNHVGEGYGNHAEHSEY